MRFLIKAITPNDSGNELIKTGKMGEVIQAIVEHLKPEATYFLAENGQRTGYYFVNMDNGSDIPAMLEPLFLSSSAHVEITPVMSLEDFAQSADGIQAAVKKFS